MKTYRIFHDDCFNWLKTQPENSIHAVCTDPPYGLAEFSEKELHKLRKGKGGTWRIPPEIGGCRRDPLPRFTTLTNDQKNRIRIFFQEWGHELMRIIVPGGHICAAGTPSLQYLVQGAMADAGFEVRSAILRLYNGFRGGDRPKNAEKEYPEVCVTPRSAYEPWMLFRKPISEKTVAQNLKKWGTGGLRRLNTEKPFPEILHSFRTPEAEKKIADHPCLKPQKLMRVLVRALLPLGQGIVADTFMGAGSTIAAAEAVSYLSVGIEIDDVYYETASVGIPLLAELYPGFSGDCLCDPQYPRGSQPDRRQMNLPIHIPNP